MTLRADVDSEKSIAAYSPGLRQRIDWLPTEVGPADVDPNHLRGWIVHLLADHRPATVRLWLDGVKSFYRFLLAENKIPTDPTSGDPCATTG